MVVPTLVHPVSRERFGVQDYLAHVVTYVEGEGHLVAADTGGHIAYQCRGELPVRSGDAGRRLPVPGWDDGCEWTGTVPFQ